jgi:DNA-binding GntR family transcriptional regulator
MLRQYEEYLPCVERLKPEISIEHKRILDALRNRDGKLAKESVEREIALISEQLHFHELPTGDISIFGKISHQE